MRVAQGPSIDAHLVRIWRTTGVDISTLRNFEIIHDWTQSRNAHRVLPFTWVGKTEFHLAQDALVNF